MRNYFSFQRVTLEFEALEPRSFPAGKAGNVVRGALGWALRDSHPELYARYFEPRQAAGTGPSGFANPPRPFVLRAYPLDGRTFQTGETFSVDLHLFLDTPAEAFIDALSRLRLGQLRNVIAETIVVPLEGPSAGVRSVTLRFVTPTELKSAGGLATVPEFPIVFARVRDRLLALSGHSLTLDFEGMAQRAVGIAVVSQRILQQRRVRTSSKTGQTHPIAGFTGEAEYHGDLDEFLPLLKAAHWTGIGRQTVWGKGVIDIVGEL
jgi:hypothetical protein